MDKFHSIDKLEGERNWVSWKFDVELQLTIQKVMPLVKGDLRRPDVLGENATAAERKAYEDNLKAYEESDAIAKYIIGSTVRCEAKQHILTCRSGKEMWDTLHSVYEQKNERRLDLLYSQLFNYCKDPIDDIATHVSKLQKIWQELQDELKTENVQLPKSMLMNRILNTLPNEYLEFRNAWESVPSKDRSIPSLVERLRLHEQRLNEITGPKCESNKVALLVKTNNDSKKQPNKAVASKTVSDSKKKFKCFHCGQNGHYKRDCKLLKTKSAESKTSPKSGQAFMTVKSECGDHDFWLIDSGSSHHVTSRADWFSSYSEFSEPRRLRLGDGRAMFAKGMGDIQIEMLVSGKWLAGYLQNVWYVPGSDQNLFSSGSALDKGLTEYADNKTREFRNKAGHTVAVGIRQTSGIYKLLMRVLAPSLACSAYSSDNDLQVWHERLGHQNKQHVQKLLKQKGIEVKVDKKVCDACMFGKMHRLSFGTRKDRPTEPGALINADVCGPMPRKSLGGNRYYVVFKDDFSKYRTVYFLKEKSEVKDKLAQFLAEVKIIKHSVKELLTDGGGEFNNSEVLKITQEYGLSHRMTMPYTPQQNGAAEQENRTLVEAARTMLHAKDLPEFLWAEAVNTAAYVINRTGPTPVERKSPYELWHGKEPCIGHLKVFGTECFIYVPKEKRRKFDKKAKKGYLVGYCGDKDGYRVWIPSEGNIVLTRDIIFKKEEASKVIFNCPDKSSGDLYQEGDIEDDKETEAEDAGEVNYEQRENPEAKFNLRDRSKLKKPSTYKDFVMMAEFEEPTTYQQYDDNFASEDQNYGDYETDFNDAQQGQSNSDVEDQGGGGGDTATSSKSSSEEDKKLFIGGISKDTNQKDLKEYFSKFDEVIEVNIKTDPTSGRSRGFAFVAFGSRDSVDSVLHNGPHTINGLQIYNLEDGSIFNNNEAYCKNVLDRFSMSNTNPVSVPIERSAMSGDPNAAKNLHENVPYRQAVGSFMYSAVVSRPDIAYAVSQLSQVLDRPQEQHWNMVKRVLKYLKGTVKLGILYQTNVSCNLLEFFSDADYAGDSISRKSTSGIVVKYNGGAIGWSSRRQKCIALSTTEAEFVAACQASKEAVWFQGLFKEMCVSELPIPSLQIDNESAIRLIKNPEFHNRTKHIDIQYKFVREKYENGELNVHHVSSEFQVADLFTKPVPKARFKFLCDLVGMFKP